MTTSPFHSAKYSGWNRENHRIWMVSQFINYMQPPTPSHQQHAGKSRFLKPLPLDFLTMLSRKSDEISGDAQNQRHCQIFFSRERNCKRFYIFCSTPRHGQGLSLVVQFRVTVILLIKWEISQDTFTKYCNKIAKFQNYKIVTFRKQF